MTKGVWKYKKAQGHHHVLFPTGEVLDVQNESDARLIALIPEMIDLFLWLETCHDSNFITTMCNTIRKHIYRFSR